MRITICDHLGSGIKRWWRRRAITIMPPCQKGPTVEIFITSHFLDCFGGFLRFSIFGTGLLYKANQESRFKWLLRPLKTVSMHHSGQEQQTVWNMRTWKPTQLMGRTLIGYLHEETCLNGTYMERMWKNMEKDQASQTTCSLIFHVFTSLSLWCLLQLHPSHLDGTLQGRGIFHKFNWGPGQVAAKFNALLWHHPLKLHLFPEYKKWWLQF